MVSLYMVPFFFLSKVKISNISLIIFVLIVFCGCKKDNTLSYELLMKEEIDKAEKQNQEYIPFTTDSILLNVVDYYEQNGNSNEKMKAHYLLGCAYRDMGEAPLAIKQFHLATEAADTLEPDCNYSLLCRIHSQMSALFYEELLPMNQYKESKAAEKYAWMAKDTLYALISFEKQADSYDLQNKSDSAAFILDEAYRRYIKYGYDAYAYKVCSSLIYHLIMAGNYNAAKKYVRIYDKHINDNSLSEHNSDKIKMYYLHKGLFFMRAGQNDSAFVYLRKGIENTKCLDNLEAGYSRLYEVYKLEGMRDSALKYAELCYQITEEKQEASQAELVFHIQSLYNYDRYASALELSKAEKRNAMLWMYLYGGLTLFLFLTCVTIYKVQKRKKQEDISKLTSEFELYKDRLEHAKSDLLKIRDKELKLLSLEKENSIKQLQEQFSNYRSVMIEKDPHFIDKRLKKSEIFNRFVDITRNPLLVPTNDEWEQLRLLVASEIPSFKADLNKGRRILRAIEMDICILERLNFTPADMVQLTQLKPSNISMMRKRLNENIFNDQPDTKLFHNNIMAIV